MKNSKLNIGTRLLVALSGLALIAVLYLPIWRIELNAPQYPEGLALIIHANGIRGNVDIINGLNHYIGMKTLHDKDFPEFSILPFCIVFFSLLFLLSATINKKKWFYTAFFMFVAFGILAIVDFWRWEYNYGHNLDPHAAIIVPGMAYQPPLIGYKQLLNFAAYSMPDKGGWIFIGCGALLLLCVFIEYRVATKSKTAIKSAAVLLPLLLALTSCNSEPQPIRVGIDNCAYCKMTIADPRFGAEIVTPKGKVYKFDDIQCMNAYCEALVTDAQKTVNCYLTDFCGLHTLIPAHNAVLLESNKLKCPMDGHLIAFSSLDSLDKIKQIYPGKTTHLSLVK